MLKSRCIFLFLARAMTRFFATAGGASRCTTRHAASGSARAARASQSSRCWCVWLQRSTQTLSPLASAADAAASHFWREPSASWQTTTKPLALRAAASVDLPQPGMPQSTTRLRRASVPKAPAAAAIMNAAPLRSKASSAAFSQAGCRRARRSFFCCCFGVDHSAMMAGRALNSCRDAGGTLGLRRQRRRALDPLRQSLRLDAGHRRRDWKRNSARLSAARRPACAPFAPLRELGGPAALKKRSRRRRPAAAGRPTLRRPATRRGARRRRCSPWTTTTARTSTTTGCSRARGGGRTPPGACSRRACGGRGERPRPRATPSP